MSDCFPGCLLEKQTFRDGFDHWSCHRSVAGAFEKKAQDIELLALDPAAGVGKFLAQQFKVWAAEVKRCGEGRAKDSELTEDELEEQKT